MKEKEEGKRSKLRFEERIAIDDGFVSLGINKSVQLGQPSRHNFQNLYFVQQNFIRNKQTYEVGQVSSSSSSCVSCTFNILHFGSQTSSFLTY